MREPEAPREVGATGAYGFTVTGLVSSGLSAGLVPVPDGGRWATLHVTWRLGTSGRPDSHFIGQDRAEILLLDGEYVDVECARGTATFHAATPLTDLDLVHPYLATPAALVARSHGRLALHAGGLLVDGVAWALLGGKESGKTTMMAECAARGHSVLADDLVVVDGRTAFSGPRGLDLRRAAAARFDTGAALVAVRGGERWRLSLPPIPAEVPFGGCVVLAESDRAAMTAVPLVERVGLLTPHLLVGHGAERQVLDVLALPMWVLQRPKDWRQLSRSADLLVTTLAKHRSG
jgi:hypothetical protein